MQASSFACLSAIIPPSTALASGVVVFLEADGNRGEYQSVIFAR
jgi:hypothetical protein